MKQIYVFDLYFKVFTNYFYYFLISDYFAHTNSGQLKLPEILDIIFEGFLFLRTRSEPEPYHQIGIHLHGKRGMNRFQSDRSSNQTVPVAYMCVADKASGLE